MVGVINIVNLETDTGVEILLIRLFIQKKILLRSRYNYYGLFEFTQIARNFMSGGRIR